MMNELSQSFRLYCKDGIPKIDFVEPFTLFSHFFESETLPHRLKEVLDVIDSPDNVDCVEVVRDDLTFAVNSKSGRVECLFEYLGEDMVECGMPLPLFQAAFRAWTTFVTTCMNDRDEH